MKDAVDFDEHLYHCYVASLYNNIIPLKPQEYLVKPARNGLVVSIGSLVFFKVLKTNGIKRCNSVDSFFATLPKVKTTSYGKAKCLPIRKRSTPILVKCTLYSNCRQFSDTVVISLNRAGVAGLREAQVETQSANVQPVKHRFTYCTRSVKDARVKQTSALASLSRNAISEVKADSLESQSCSFPPLFMCRLYKRTRMHSFLKRLVKRLPKQQQKRHNQVFDETNATYVNNGMKHCRYCKHWASRKTLHLNVPLIIPVGCIINFEPRVSTEFFRGDLKLYCELYVDNVEIATSTVRLSETNVPGVNASMVSFYADGAFGSPIHSQELRQCCCKLKDMLLCSLHFTWMLNQVSSLYTVICKAEENVVVYRFLLYFFLQMSAFMQNRNLKMCMSHTVPVALMSIMVHSYQERSAEAADRTLDENCRLVLSNIFNQGGTRIFDKIYEKTKDLKLRNVKALVVLLSDLDVDNTSFKVDGGAVSQTIAFPVSQNPNDAVPITTSPLCKRSVEIMSQFADMFTINSKTLVYSPEPYDLLVLKQLVQRPMYDVHMRPRKEQFNTVDTDGHTVGRRNGNGDSGNTFSGTEDLSFGSMKHKQINALIWKYYGILCKSGCCLATFLRFVDWSDTKEAFDALLLLRLWARPPTECLVELVSVDFAPPHVPKCVRGILVELLKDRLTPVQVTHYTFQFIYSSTRRAHYANDPLYIWIMDNGTKNYETGVHLYWILKCACMNVKSGQTFLKVLKDFVIRLKTSHDPITRHIMQTIKLQHSFKSEMVELKQLINVQWSGNASERTSLLVNHLLSNTHQWAKLGPYVCKDTDKPMEYLVKFGRDIPLLTDPSVCIRGIYPRGCSVVRSNNTPLLLNLLTDTQEKNVLLMFKTGEDIRQDQFCQQLVRVFNDILAKHRVASYLVGYGVLPTGIKDGCVQFLSDSQSISAILKQYNGLEAYLAAHCNGAPDLKQRKTNFIYSLAAYSVFTYVLGVGDRHHDNMLITKEGYVVHVDYTFVFGADPKPLPSPPFRLSKEMVDLMGGTRTKWYYSFKNRFFRIFFTIRLHANFIIQLLYHALNAHLQHLTLETIIKVEARFALGINDFRQLEQHVNKLVDSSCNALVPAVLERWHEWVLTWK